MIADVLVPVGAAKDSTELVKINATREMVHAFTLGTNAAVLTAITDKAIFKQELDFSQALVAGLQAALIHWGRKHGEALEAERQRKRDIEMAYRLEQMKQAAEKADALAAMKANDSSSNNTPPGDIDDNKIKPASGQDSGDTNSAFATDFLSHFHSTPNAYRNSSFGLQPPSSYLHDAQDLAMIEPLYSQVESTDDIMLQRGLDNFVRQTIHKPTNKNVSFFNRVQVGAGYIIGQGISVLHDGANVVMDIANSGLLSNQSYDPRLDSDYISTSTQSAKTWLEKSEDDQGIIDRIWDAKTQPYHYGRDRSVLLYKSKQYFSSGFQLGKTHASVELDIASVATLGYGLTRAAPRVAASLYETGASFRQAHTFRSPVLFSMDASTLNSGIPIDRISIRNPIVKKGATSGTTGSATNANAATIPILNLGHTRT